MCEDVCATAGGDVWKLGESAGARWVFPTRPDEAVNQVVDFLHGFDCADPAGCQGLRISADTDFVVWLNGSLVGDGQFSDYPDQKTYAQFPVEGILRQGQNTLAVTVFYNGSNSFVYRRGRPGLVFDLVGCESSAASGVATRCRPNPAYHSGPIAKVSGQLFYTFGYDARGEDDFCRDDYRPGPAWQSIQQHEATLPAERHSLAPRPVERLVDSGPAPATLKAAGLFRRDLSHVATCHDAAALEQTTAGLELASGETVSVAWQMQHDFLSAQSTFSLFGQPPGTDLADLSDGLRPVAVPPGDHDGVYLVVDLGREEAGPLTLEITAAAGVTLDIGYGEHLEDLRVRTFVGGRHFAARYICREGHQSFMHHFQRWGGRYLQIHIHATAFTLHRLSLQRRQYPLEARGSLAFGDHRLPGEIMQVCRRTLHLCMHEHYEDTPWREQALYANDARIQALCGYYAFGETRFPAASFSLLGRGLRDDGFLALTAPAGPKVTIPSFTFAWMLAVRDHYLYSGEASLVRQFLPQMRSMLAAFLAERREGLLPLRRAPEVWHFYDWSGGMSRYTDEQFAAGLDADLPLNAFLILAIEAVLDIMRWCGETAPDELVQGVRELRQGAAERFWDAQEGAFRTHANATELTELTQALAVLAGVGTASQRESVLHRMNREDGALAAPGLSQSFYTFQARMTRKDIGGAHVLAEIERHWGMMLRAGATSFWETTRGAADFHNAGSLCHGWSAVPLYVYFHDVLGIQPVEPGFRVFTINPLKDHFDACRGRVPVPDGEITLEWGPHGVQHSAPPACRLQADTKNLDASLMDG